MMGVASPMLAFASAKRALGAAQSDARPFDEASRVAHRFTQKTRRAPNPRRLGGEISVRQVSNSVVRTGAKGRQRRETLGLLGSRPSVHRSFCFEVVRVVVFLAVDFR